MVLVAVFGVALRLAVLLSGLTARTDLSTPATCLAVLSAQGAVLDARSPEAKETFEPLGDSLAELSDFRALSVSRALLTPQLFGGLSSVGAGTAAHLVEQLIGGS
ncbi:hypothetical protein ACFVZD_40970 [Streptomyces sp. NPDC058287]|uniref:hypothetical protein n=1 Tax=unclassified Streptomyces TaxID=2593676 RepID=UPI0036E282F7